VRVDRLGSARKSRKDSYRNDVIEQIKAHVGVPWQEPTVDTFKAGDPHSRVAGIAVTMMTTLDVLQRAARERQNLIITHEPTFYDHMDDPKQLPQGENDAVLKQKREFVAEHHLVIWRFHDYWHRRNRTGLKREMYTHWAGKKSGSRESYLFTIPETTVAKLAEDLRVKLHAALPRIAGDREMKVTRVAFSPGSRDFAAKLARWKCLTCSAGRG